MKRNKFLGITNQELIYELEKRLANNDFTQDDLEKLMIFLSRYQKETLQIIQEVSPKTYNWIQERRQQMEQEKTDQEIEKVKKSLEKK